MVYIPQHDDALWLRVLRSRGAAPTAGQRLHGLLDAVQPPSPRWRHQEIENQLRKRLRRGLSVYEHNYCTETFLPNGQESATPVEAYATEPVPSAVQELLSIITIAVTGIITIARGLWKLLTYRSTVVEIKTLTASRGSAFATLTNGRTFQPNSNEMTTLVNSGATKHVLDDELIPGLKDRMMNPTLLDVPKTIITAGIRKLLGTMTGTINGTITDETGRTHRAHFPSLFVSGLGRHIFSPTASMTRGITTTLEEGNSHLRKGSIVVVVQLEQQLGDRGMYSLKVRLEASDSGAKISSTTAIALTAQVSADIWHRRLGHINTRSMELLRKTKNNGVDYTGTLSGCDI